MRVGIICSSMAMASARALPTRITMSTACLALEWLDAVPVFAARAPFGIVAADAFHTLLSRMDAAIDRAGPVDGLRVAPHGATVAANHPAADRFCLTRLRQRFGRKSPITGTLDLHANLSPKMVAACDTLIAYRSNPHLDQRDRGIDAARLLARTLRGEVRPTMAAGFLPLAVNVERQSTAEAPWPQVYQNAGIWLRERGVLSTSVVMGFPYADVPEMGASAIAVTDNDFARAELAAGDFGGYWSKKRELLVGRLISIAQALDQAAKLEGPITLLDMGDNIDGGSPGDGTEIVRAIHRHPSLMPAVACLCDPAQRSRSQRRPASVRKCTCLSSARPMIVMANRSRPILWCAVYSTENFKGPRQESWPDGSPTSNRSQSQKRDSGLGRRRETLWLERPPGLQNIRNGLGRIPLNPRFLSTKTRKRIF